MKLRQLTLLALVALHAGDAVAQTTSAGSRYLPVDHWAYEYIARLRDRGILLRLSPLVQPYRRGEVAEELSRLDPDTLREPIAGWVRMLRTEFARDVATSSGRDGARFGVGAMAGTRSSTSRRLDAARPLGTGGIWPWWRAGAWAETGPVAVETRLYGDLYLHQDPDGLDPGQRRGGRSDNAYVSVTVPTGALVVGRYQRNWSALGTTGLMVSPIATPYPSLGLELRAGRLTLNAFVGELDTILGEKRFLSGHRLEYGHGNLRVAVGETILYASPRGGPGLRYLNPVEVFFFDQDTEPADLTTNVVLDAQVWARVGSVVVRGEAMLDDIEVLPLPPGEPRAPIRGGLDVGIVWARRYAPFTVSVGYRRVSSFAYRTTLAVDRYTYLERGIGDNFADYDRLTVAAEWFPALPGLILGPTLIVQRQGEGGVREPFPEDFIDFKASPDLFLGVRETTYRAALRGRYQPHRFVWLAWDLGPNVIRNRDHETGVNETAFEATGEIGVRFDLPWRAPH